MKYLGLVFLAQATIANWVEYTSTPLVTNDDGTTEDADDSEVPIDRIYGNTGNMMEIVMCPPNDPNKPAYCEEGFTLFSGNQMTFRAHINRLIRHHGCNCFPDNKFIPHPTQNRMIVAPGVNGAPKNALDEACTVLAKRNRCLEIDNVNYECTFGENYRFWYNDVTHEVSCGIEGRNIYNRNDYTNRPDLACERQRCFMDMEFIENVITALDGKNVREYFLDQRRYDRKTKVENNLPELECVSDDNNVFHDECCGAYTKRSPFDSAVKRCCNDNLVIIGSGREVDFCS